MAETPKQDVEFLQQFEPDVFWQQHGKKILIAVGAVVLIGLAVFYRQKLATEQEEAVAAEVSQTRDPAALQRIAQDYRGKPIGAQALLSLANVQIQSGQDKAAVDTFEQFLKEFPNHAMAESAHLGLAATQEAMGNFEAAKERYLQVASTFPNGYTAIAARLGAARCAEALGQTKEALQTYEELRPMVPGTPWETEVSIRSLVLGRTVSSADVTNPPPAAEPESAPIQP